MKKNFFFWGFVCFLTGMLLYAAGIFDGSRQKVSRIKLPPGFKIAIYATSVPDARCLTVGDKGTVFVGSRSEGKVYALVDRNKDNKADAVYVIADDLHIPNGVAFYKGDLYVAEVHRIIKFEGIEEKIGRRKKIVPVEINNKLPREVLHGWRYLRVGPDHLLYVSVGAPCDVCKEKDKRYASILRLKPDGTTLEVFAHGVRQCEGFDWNPKSHGMYFTDNGRESRDQSASFDELDYAAHKGMHFGFPYCHGAQVLDGEFGGGRSCDNFTGPVFSFPVRVAPLGICFYTGKQFPEEYRNRIFVAEHGANDKGYRISMITPGDGSSRYAIFASGWFYKNTAWGRPVDLLVMPDGSLLVSDDRAGAVYRISYSKK